MKAVFSSFFTLACPWVDVELTVLGVAPILFYYWNFLGRDFVFLVAPVLGSGLPSLFKKIRSILAGFCPACFPLFWFFLCLKNKSLKINA